MDQPIGTGFSYTNSKKINVTNTFEAGDMFLEFLDTFYKWFPNMTSLKTSIFGESYAGHYVPYFAELFVRNNKWNVPF
jgi:carboxypeptidase C (cathepsin A)